MIGGVKRKRLCSLLPFTYLPLEKHLGLPSGTLVFFSREEMCKTKTRQDLEDNVWSEMTLEVM